MDTLYESEFGTRALHLPAVAPPPRVPRWVSAVGLLTLGLAAASVVCVALLFAQTASSHLVAPAAVVLATLALGCGVAAIVGRSVHGAMIGKLDLLNQALATATNAHLVTRDGAVIYANTAFGRCFPGLVGPPLDALQRRLVIDEGSASDINMLRRDLDNKGRAFGPCRMISHPAGPVATGSASRRIASPAMWG